MYGSLRMLCVLCMCVRVCVCVGGVQGRRELARISEPRWGWTGYIRRLTWGGGGNIGFQFGLIG